MLLPVIYIRDGFAVDAEGNRATLGGGDPLEVARALQLLGEISLFDLDAEEGKGSNTSVIKSILHFAECRVGGGIRSAEDALDWLDIGASKVVLGGPVLSKEILDEIPKSRVCVALDGSSDNLLDNIKQWQSSTEEMLLMFPRDPAGELPLATVKAATAALEGTKITITVGGCVETAAHVVELDTLNALTQIGAALLSESMSLGDVVVAFLKTDRTDGLYTTVVVDEAGVALGLVYSNDDSVRAAMSRKKGIYHSRRRGLWEKGLSSGATQDLIGVSLDCDRDALRYVVHQHGAGFCHLDRRTCWCEDWGVGKLMRTLEDRVQHPEKDPKSYTLRLLKDDKLLASKLLEEAGELIEAETPTHVAFECADVIYFAAVCLARAKVPWKAVEQNLDNKSRRIRRRKGNAKPAKVEKKAVVEAVAAKSAPAQLKTTTSSIKRDLFMMSLGAGILGAGMLLRRN